ncbi:MAG: alpha/beta hydrolase [Cellvibrionaceae bacterium]
MSELDPAVQELLVAMAKLNLTPLHCLEPDQARAGMKLMVPDVPPTPVDSVADHLCESGGASFGLRVYRPNSSSSLPALVFYHGGGWVVCDLETHDELCRQIASKVQCLVVSVDYRLAPEHKFPRAVDDAYNALLWVHNNADILGIDRKKIAVGGDSAGGNLAAAICIKSRDCNGPEICHQSLWYPVTNVSDLSTLSYSQFAQGYRLERAGMRWFIDHYLERAEDAQSKLASPLLCDNLSGLPSAYVMTAGFDVLRDEGKAYAEKLSEHGNEVIYECFESLIHGFMNMGAVAPAAQTAIDRVAGRLLSAFSAGRD